MISITTAGDFKKTLSFLYFTKSGRMFSILERYGDLGVDALSRATPIDSGETAASWSYRTSHRRGVYSIEWFNSHNDGGPPVAILIQYGHATGTGGYVQGRDFINPALRPVFDKLAEDIWRQVKNG